MSRRCLRNKWIYLSVFLISLLLLFELNPLASILEGPGQTPLCDACDADSKLTRGQGAKVFEYKHSLRRNYLSVLTDEIGPEKFQLVPQFVNDLPYLLILYNDKLCFLPNGEKPFLLVLVPSVQGNAKMRNAIRETWGSLAYNGGKWGSTMVVKETVRLAFLIGESPGEVNALIHLSKEAEKNKDMLLADFNDEDLALKTLYGLAWADKFCKGVRYVLKADEDTFVHLPYLISFLQHIPDHDTSFVLGHEKKSDEPVDSPLRALANFLRSFEPSRFPFPAHLNSHTYVISGPAISTLNDAYRHMEFTHVEAPFITGALCKATNVTRLSYPLFADNKRQPVICHIASGQFISITNCCEEHHRAIYKDITNGFCDSRHLTEVAKCHGIWPFSW